MGLNSNYAHNKIFIPTTSSELALNEMDPQSAPLGSAMLNHGRGQSFVDSEISSIGRDLVIFNWNGSSKVQDKIPIFLGQQTTDPEVATPKGPIAITPITTMPIKDAVGAAGLVAPEDVEKSSIYNQELSSLVSSLFKTMDQSIRQEQSLPGLRLAATDQLVGPHSHSELQDHELKGSIGRSYIRQCCESYALSTLNQANTKGKSRATNVDLEESVQDLDPWVYVVGSFRSYIADSDAMILIDFYSRARFPFCRRAKTTQCQLRKLCNPYASISPWISPLASAARHVASSGVSENWYKYWGCWDHHS